MSKALYKDAAGTKVKTAPGRKDLFGCTRHDPFCEDCCIMAENYNGETRVAFKGEVGVIISMLVAIADHLALKCKFNAETKRYVADLIHRILLDVWGLDDEPENDLDSRCEDDGK